MNDDLKTRRLRDGYQPKRNELTKGYPVTESVDLTNLKIPKNLGTAAVIPRKNGNPAPVGAKPQKP